ncbi:type II toxin-antitoxin system RelE/ParE family toxin [Synergistaceae bacterium OttesenSCG-928-I11]|nr:type II toxin-antitoxin system RelE/ParE family toxin [Synergistaceae bacterium OttesenSCG-928-I11]
MKILQTNRFKKAYKSLHPNQLPPVNRAIADVIETPEIGERKVGDLSWLRVHKFKLLGQFMLLGYSMSEAQEVVLTFIDIAPHENFYRDLKR